MTHRDAVLLHRDAIRDAASCHKARSIALVGSVARGDNTPDSDCDFVADFLPGASLFDHIDLEEALKEILGVSVDVISVDAARRRFPRILQEAIAI
ncbi:MAG: nucleotidyltransferase domain-containing protein [bacterium]|nr:nucleotidyltransferase domain-containing protein [Acidimicrobiia bacterium]MCY4650168.1 nucleotidyltransferase domain-containing protein [bacterium]